MSDTPVVPDDEVLEFSTELKERGVTIDGKSYVLREASGDVGRAYRNACLRGSKVDSNTKVMAIGSPSDAEAVLVAGCLHTTNKDGKPHQQVPQRTVLAWPDRIQKSLFRACLKLSPSLQEKDDDKGKDRDDQEKNSLPSSEDGSELALALDSIPSL